MTREKTNYAERRSGELLPRRAREYHPPRAIPRQPDALTMENESIKLAAELDPRNARTQLSMKVVRSKRRVWVGLLFGMLIGTLLGALMWVIEQQSTPRPGPTAAGAPVPEALRARAPTAPSEPVVEVLDSDEPAEGEVIEIVGEGSEATSEGEGADPAAARSAGAKARTAPPNQRRSPGSPKQPVSRKEQPAKAQPSPSPEPSKQNKVWVNPEPERKVWLK